MFALAAFAFFIKADTSPAELGSAKFGRTSSVVLYDAPSKAAAEKWAKDFAQRRLLGDHPDQRLTNLKVLAVHDHLFTSTGDESINWDALVERVRATEHYHDHATEFGIGMVLKVDAKRLTSSLTGAVPFDSELIEKQLPNANEWNWDEEKLFHYVLYNEKQAYIVRAMNMIVCGQPYFLAMEGRVNYDQSLVITTWPGAVKYEN